MTSNVSDTKPVTVWLFSICALIFLMVVVGGVTRLTESGLSMVSWKPVTGVIPPLTEEAWQAEFDAYRQYPEYQKINRGMSLGEFKNIFWWEFSHRLLGRLIGLAFAIPALYFLVRGQIAAALKPKLALMFFLGACQGALGWYMVKSGLVDRPDVSHYRLTAHLGLAFLIYCYIFWVALGLVTSRPVRAPHRQKQSCRPLLIGLLHLLVLQIILGGFVAGLDAGFAYNTWPLMGGKVIPDGLFMLSPFLHNFTENIITIQFLHRMVAYLIAVLAVMLWWRAWNAGDAKLRMAGHFMLATITVQIMLGVLTLVYFVPIPLGAAHQGGALVVLTACLYLLHRERLA